MKVNYGKETVEVLFKFTRLVRNIGFILSGTGSDVHVPDLEYDSRNDSCPSPGDRHHEARRCNEYIHSLAFLY